MFTKIKNEIDANLSDFIKSINKTYSIGKISPLLFKCIKNFVLRDGKRIRPVLFVIGYLGFAKKKAKGLYQSALAIEFLHDFMLVHDDIIDKSDTRRGKPSMHAMLNTYLNPYKNKKFNGQDMSVVAGDVMYAIAIDSFLSIQEDMRRKEKALKYFIKAAMFTGCGEFIELLAGLKPLEKITKTDIYKIYDYKTAYYTFSAPLATGAILAGARSSQIDLLADFGICLGRAFQIKDDILGTFGDEKKTGKSTLSDLQEAKKTILILNAYKLSNYEDKQFIKETFLKPTVTTDDLKKIRAIIEKSKALNKAKKEISALLKKAETNIKYSKLKPVYKKALSAYCTHLLQISS